METVKSNIGGNQFFILLKMSKKFLSPSFERWHAGVGGEQSADKEM